MAIKLEQTHFWSLSHFYNRNTYQKMRLRKKKQAPKNSMSKEPGSVSYHSGKLVLNLTHFYNMQHMHLENGLIKSFLSPWASTHLTGLLVRETRRDSNTRRRFSPFKSALRTSATKFWGVSRSLCLAWNKGIQMKLLS